MCIYEVVSITGHQSLHEATTVHIQVPPSASLCNPCFCLRALIIVFKLEICVRLMSFYLFIFFPPSFIPLSAGSCRFLDFSVCPPDPHLMIFFLPTHTQFILLFNSLGSVRILFCFFPKRILLISKDTLN